MNTAYRAVYCDVDGTIVDSAPGVTHCVAAALAELGWPSEYPATLMLHVCPPMEAGFEMVSGMDAATAHEAVRRFRVHYAADGVYEGTLFEGVPQMLEELRSRGILLATATSKRESMAEVALRHLGVADLFDRIVGATPERENKTAVLREARAQLRAAGLASGPEALLGDRVFDAVGATENGIDFVAAGWGYAPDAAELATARWVAPSPRAAAPILSGRAAPSDRPVDG